MQSSSVTIRGLWTWSFTLLFVALKLTGQIDWNWLVVMLPLIASIVVSNAFGLYLTHKNNKNAEVESQKEQPVVPTGFYA